ncbi:MAG: hypothetical protein Q8N82_08240, partial [Deltaproteobacteria bacterium]|nr:hypothetical protein [Deltaproteobacteria bacterium]
GTGLRVYVHLLRALFLRAVDRAERDHEAMFSRAFNGHFYAARRSGITWQDGIFLLAWAAFFVLCRWYNISEIIGRAALRVMHMI